MPQITRLQLSIQMRRPNRKHAKHPVFTAVSVFAGAGGLTEGFRQAGFRIALAVEENEVAAQTLLKNHRHTHVHCGPLEALNVGRGKWVGLLESAEVDLVIGGPPCQGFSIKGQRNGIHPYNGLYKEFIRTVQLLRPKCFVMENVPGLLGLAGGYFFDSIHRALERMSPRYSITWDILNASNFGVPQLRKRIFFIGTKKKLRLTFKFPRPTGPVESVTVRDAITDLPKGTVGADQPIPYAAESPLTSYQDQRRNGSAVVFNHTAKRLLTLRRKRVACLEQGDDKRALPDKLQAGGHDTKYRRLHADEPAPTLTAHMGKDCSDFIHPFYDRCLSAREAARLQSFDDRYKFCGSQVQQLLQIGNAVPVLLARAIARRILSMLKKQQTAGR